jgi:antitoxin component YwqK of YwqJK toxin-antitoxin module
VHLRLPRALVEDILRAQCYVEMRRFFDGSRDEFPYVNGKRHGTATWWHADGAREVIPYVNGERHGTKTWWRADGSRVFEFTYVNGKPHGTVTRWRADGSLIIEDPYGT